MDTGQEDTLPANQETPNSTISSEGIVARKGADGITLTDEQKEAFSNAGIRFSYLQPGRFSSIGGSEAELTIIAQNDAAIDALKEIAAGLNIELNHKRSILKTAYPEMFNRGKDAKNLATILVRNGIEFEGKTLLAKDGPGGHRTI